MNEGSRGLTEPTWMNGPPKSILLATDFSSRCDRALDRSLNLARIWGATLHIVHAIEDDMLDTYDAFSRRRRGGDPLIAARTRVDADLAGYDSGVPIQVHVEMADPAALVLEVAGREECGLIVTGVARDQPLGRFLLGSVVDYLIRNAPVPLLVVRGRTRTNYVSVIVASDFSPSSRHAIEAAARLFPEASLTLFHAYDIPFGGYLEKDAASADFVRFGEEASAKFLAEADLPDGIRDRIVRLIERGDPRILLTEHACNRAGSLTVVGSHGGGALYEMFIGSTAAAIIREVPGDVLLVRDPAAGH